MDFITPWAAAIAQFEGFNVAGSRPARDHNPGDLKFAGQYGATGKDPQGFAVFPDDATGFQALYNQLGLYVSEFPNYSILQIMAHYLGQASPEVDAQGNAFTYAAAVASAIGVSTDTTLAQLAAGGSADPSGVVADGADPGADPSAVGGVDPGTLAAWVLGGVFLFWVVTRYT